MSSGDEKSGEEGKATEETKTEEKKDEGKEEGKKEEKKEEKSAGGDKPKRRCTLF